MELGAEAMPAIPGAPAGLKLSNGGNWKGSETGTRPPSIPKPSGRAEGLPRREAPAVDTCTRPRANQVHFRNVTLIMKRSSPAPKKTDL